MISRNQNFEGISFFDQLGDDTVPTHSRPDSRHNKEYSVRKTTKGVLIGVGTVAISAMLIGGAGYINGAAGALAPKASIEGKVVNPGSAEIVHVSMDMPPITLATAETKVTGLKVAFEQKLTGLFNISLGSDTVTRDGNVETLLTVDPGEVNISYDSNKKQLEFSALNTALSTKVNIPTGEATTVKKTGSLLMLSADMLVKASQAIDGTFGTDGSKVPIVREMVRGELGIEAGLEKFADLTMVTEVDKQCTPLIPEKVKNFTEQLKDNIRTAVKGQLLDPEVTKNEVSSALMNMPLSEVQKLVDNSTVELPENFAFGPDQDNIDKLQDYLKSKFFSSTPDTKSPIVCGVSDNAKLSLVNSAEKG